MKTYRCYKCGLTIPVSCSKCDRVVDVKIIGEGCLVKENKCLDCTDVPIIKDVCLGTGNINYITTPTCQGLNSSSP